MPDLEATFGLESKYERRNMMVRLLSYVCTHTAFVTHLIVTRLLESGSAVSEEWA